MPVSKVNPARSPVTALLLVGALFAAMTAIALPAGQKQNSNIWIARYEQAMSHYAVRDYDRALTDFRVLADRGSAGAQAMIGHLYERGEGVQPSPARAALWFQRAAERGFAPAQIRLADKLIAGDGMVADTVRAAMWLMLAAERGDDNAKAMAQAKLDALRPRLTDAQWADAEAARQGWRPTASLLD
jgi:uncharacterized protein